MLGGYSMLIDVTKTELFPGILGLNCPGNGMHYDSLGNEIECCCDECDYMMCCMETHSMEECKTCSNADCPQKTKFLIYVEKEPM